MVRSVLITGGNRGIGLEFVRQFLQDKLSPPDNVIAICRDPTNAKELTELKQKYPRQLHIMKLDVTNFEQYKAVVESVEEIVGKESPTQFSSARRTSERTCAAWNSVSGDSADTLGAATP